MSILCVQHISVVSPCSAYAWIELIWEGREISTHSSPLAFNLQGTTPRRRPDAHLISPAKRIHRVAPSALHLRAALSLSHTHTRPRGSQVAICKHDVFLQSFQLLVV
jgi:hypothetical protein